MQKGVHLYARAMEVARDVCLMAEAFVPRVYMGALHFVWHMGVASDAQCKVARKVQEEGQISV